MAPIYGKRKYTVRAGDTWAKASNVLGEPVEALQRANQNINALAAGQVLNVASKPKQQPLPEAPTNTSNIQPLSNIMYLPGLNNSLPYLPQTQQQNLQTPPNPFSTDTKGMKDEYTIQEVLDNNMNVIQLLGKGYKYNPDTKKYEYVGYSSLYGGYYLPGVTPESNWEPRFPYGGYGSNRELQSAIESGTYVNPGETYSRTSNWSGGTQQNLGGPPYGYYVTRSGKLRKKGGFGPSATNTIMFPYGKPDSMINNNSNTSYSSTTTSLPTYNSYYTPFGSVTWRY